MTQNIISESEQKRLARNERVKQYQRTRAGRVTKIYSSQRHCSKKRGHPMPNYSLEELRLWVYTQSNFETLYQNWVKSGFEMAQVPSCDRLDDYKPYTLDNLRLVTWAENNAHGNADMKAGINKKKLKSVRQFTCEGIFIAEHHSGRHASRVTGVQRSNLSACCRGELKSAGGYIWQYADADCRKKNNKRGLACGK